MEMFMLPMAIIVSIAAFGYAGYYKRRMNRELMKFLMSQQKVPRARPDDAMQLKIPCDSQEFQEAVEKLLTLKKIEDIEKIHHITGTMLAHYTEGLENKKYVN